MSSKLRALTLSAMQQRLSIAHRSYRATTIRYNRCADELSNEILAS